MLSRKISAYRTAFSIFNFLWFGYLTAIPFCQEINAILGEKLSAEDEDEVLAEFENLKSQVSLLLVQEFCAKALFYYFFNQFPYIGK